LLGTLALATALLLALPAAAQAAPPAITNPAFSGVTASAATLRATVDPLGGKSIAHFDFTSEADFKAGGFTGASSSAELEVPSKVKGKGDLTAGSTLVKNALASAGAFGPGQAIEATGIPTGATILEIQPDAQSGEPDLLLSAPATATGAEVELKAEGPQPISASVTGLTPATAYVFRAVAKKASGAKEEAQSEPPTTFYTLSAPPTYGPCPNDAFRSGEYAPFGHPSALLPDCRAYEQASPVDKNGNDIQGEVGFSRAAADGSGATFLATSGVPGGEGSQQIPTYYSNRGAGGWSSYGLLPPATAGSRAGLLGWTPDFSQTITQATSLNPSPEKALFIRHGADAPPVQATPYVPMNGSQQFAYAGASAGGDSIVFEVSAALPPGPNEPPIAAANPDTSNVYVYDELSGRTSLAGAMNTPSETAAALSKGAFAGPYNWAGAFNLVSTLRGGAALLSYTQGQHAVSSDGSVFFTAAGSGQIYRRLNPTAAQSNPGPGGYVADGHCAEPARACTIHVSASARTDCAEDPTCGGDAQPDPAPDPAGTRPAAFQASSIDGSRTYFTSSEELTDDANTGPVQPQAAIGRATLNGEGPAEDLRPGFLPAHALGVAVDPDGKYIYWANPATGTIGRADLTAPDPAASAEPEYIVPPPTEYETEPGISQSFPATPRYVAVDDEFVYWTNTGATRSSSNAGGLIPIDGGGTIGRAKIEPGGPEDIDSEFITGAANPQGIAVDDGNIYWVNRPSPEWGIARATITGTQVEQKYHQLHTGRPYGIALTSDYLYVGYNEPELETYGFVVRVPLEGGAEDEFIGIGSSSKIRGIAIQGNYVYWAAQGEAAIGRSPLTNFHQDFPHGCAELPACQPEFLKPIGTLDGLASDGPHLLWSINGQIPPNPGNDLYRFEAGVLSDITADPADPNGAEVVGVLGASTDGAYVYFVANADLDHAHGSFAGNCQGERLATLEGRCSLYLYHAAQISFIAPLAPAATTPGIDDALNWIPAVFNFFGDGSYTEKTSFIGGEGRTLVFRSTEDLLADYDNRGSPEYYRYRAGGALSCLTCVPTGVGPSEASLFNLIPPGVEPGPTAAAVSTRSLSADGDRFFFQTPSALVSNDTDGLAGCPAVGADVQRYPSCQDVYEWEAPGAGTCVAGGPGYSPLNQGCIYLLSPGNDENPSFFIDADEEGENVFIDTRERLVGQDTDSLTDLYDARAGGGLAAQNPLAVRQCEVEGCKPLPTPPPDFQSPPSFSGPLDPKPKRCRPGKVRRRRRCVPAKPKHHPTKSHRHGAAR
jgi:hypothetical protein